MKYIIQILLSIFFSIFIAVSIFKVEAYTENVKLEIDYLRKINNNIRLYTDVTGELTIDYINAINFDIKDIMDSNNKYNNVEELKEKYLRYIKKIKERYSYLHATVLFKKEKELSDIENKLFFDFIAFEIYSNKEQDKFRKLVWDILNINRNHKNEVLMSIDRILKSPNNLESYTTVDELQKYLQTISFNIPELLTTEYKVLLDDLFSIRLHLLEKQHSKLNGNIIIQLKEAFFTPKAYFIPEQYLNRKVLE